MINGLLHLYNNNNNNIMRVFVSIRVRAVYIHPGFVYQSLCLQKPNLKIPFLYIFESL